MKSTTWDYDKKLITEWLRLGSCNHCGECCEVMIHFSSYGNSDMCRDGETYTSEKGVWHEWEAYGRKRYWQIRIDGDTPAECYRNLGNKCYDGAVVKGLICTAWPLHPDHVNEFDNCSYRFVKLNEWELTDEKVVEEVCEIIEEKQEITE